MAVEKRNVEEYVRALAVEHGVTLALDVYDRMAQVFTNLGGDDVQLDEVEQLLVALSKKGVIEKTERVLLHAEYLRGKWGDQE